MSALSRSTFARRAMLTAPLAGLFLRRIERCGRSTFTSTRVLLLSCRCLVSSALRRRCSRAQTRRRPCDRPNKRRLRRRRLPPLRSHGGRLPRLRTLLLARFARLAPARTDRHLVRLVTRPRGRQLVVRFHSGQSHQPSTHAGNSSSARGYRRRSGKDTSDTGQNGKSAGRNRQGERARAGSAGSVGQTHRGQSQQNRGVARRARAANQAPDRQRRANARPTNQTRRRSCRQRQPQQARVRRVQRRHRVRELSRERASTASPRASGQRASVSCWVGPAGPRVQSSEGCV